MALEWLEEIERRAKAATPGPWYWEEPVFEGQIRILYSQAVPPNGGSVLRHQAKTWQSTEADMAFIAAAREDVVRLCRAVRELYEALEIALKAPGSVATSREIARAWDVLERWECGGA